MAMAGTTATTQTNATRHWSEGWKELVRLEELVATEGVGALPGCSLRPSFLLPRLHKAHASGVLSLERVTRAVSVLTRGADLFVDKQYLNSHLLARLFRSNYPTAFENKHAVNVAIAARVTAGRTLKVGLFKRSDFAKLPVTQAIIFPLGAVPKPHDKTEYRPFGDHTKSRLNEAGRPWKHSLDALNELKRKLSRNRFLRMSDIDGAFTLLPLVPWLWPYMLFLWFDVDLRPEQQLEANVLYCHLFADFGTVGCPLEWFEFFTVVLDLARMEGVLKSDLVLYVDDLSHIGDEGSTADRLDEEGRELDDFLALAGTPTKPKKTRSAARIQLCLGLWWNTINFTLRLIDDKVVVYDEYLRDMASRSVVSLRDMQRIAGREQRVALTLMPGSKVLLANNFVLMAGLRLPHHHRRTTRAWRADRAAMVRCLNENAGRGYYRYDDFLDGGDVWTDASKPGKGRAGGGYVLDTGSYHWWTFGSSASRNPIDYLEGKTVVFCLEDCGSMWSGKIVRFHIDNQAFQASAVKGWSHAERLNELLRELLYLSVKFNCILVYEWISTHANVLADPLSRLDEPLFLSRASGADSPVHGPLARHPDAGARR